MKKFFGASGLVMIILFFLQSGTSSCTKEVTVYDTVTIIEKDTIVIKDTAISLGLLTAHAWKKEEIRGVDANTLLYYKRGGSNNTESFDMEYIQFNANKTGTYFDGLGTTHPITWDFSNADSTKLTIIIQNPSPIPAQTVVYENLRYKNKLLLFDQYWSYNNRNSHAQVIRSPR